MGNVRCSLGRSNFSCREVASRCLSSGSFALDVSSGEVTEGGGGARSSSGCPGSPAYPCALAPPSCTRHPWVQGRGPQPPEEAAPFLGLRSPALPGFPGTREPPLKPRFSAFLFFSFELRNEAGPSPGSLAEPPPPPPTRINTQLVAELGHLLEAEVSFHFEMPLQVPRNEKNSCCRHHQLFPQTVLPGRLPWRTLLMRAARRAYPASRSGRSGRRSAVTSPELRPGRGAGGGQSLSPSLPAQQAFGIFILSTDVNWLCHLEGLTPRLGVEDSQV